MIPHSTPGTPKNWVRFIWGHWVPPLRPLLIRAPWPASRQRHPGSSGGHCRWPRLGPAPPTRANPTGFQDSFAEIPDFTRSPEGNSLEHSLKGPPTAVASGFGLKTKFNTKTQPRKANTFRMNYTCPRQRSPCIPVSALWALDIHVTQEDAERDGCTWCVSCAF